MVKWSAKYLWYAWPPFGGAVIPCNTVQDLLAARRAILRKRLLLGQALPVAEAATGLDWAAAPQGIWEGFRGGAA